MTERTDPEVRDELASALTLTDRRAEYLAGVPSMFRGITERAFAGQLSPRAAIKAKCLGCTGFVRADITDCTSALCELWPLRPYQRSLGGDSGLEAAQTASDVSEDTGGPK